MRRTYLIIAAMLISVTAFAQRTVSGQVMLNIGYNPVRMNEFSAGAGQYLENGFWFGNILFGVDRVDRKDLTLGARGGYLWRLAANSRRSVNLYGGVAGSVCYHNLSPHSVYLYDEMNPDDPVVFYNDARDIRTSVQPVLELEFFPFNAVSLFLSGYAPFEFTAPVGYEDRSAKKNPHFGVSVEGSLGVRFLF